MVWVSWRNLFLLYFDFFGQLFSYCMKVYLSGLFETSSLLKPTN